MLSDFISLFFPGYCVGCKDALVRKESIICINCQYEIPKTNSHLEKPNFVENKFFGKVKVERALAYYKFERKGRLQKILHQLKYSNRPEIGNLIGEWYGRELEELNLKDDYDMIVPVPLHSTKLRRRGYNQSAAFGEGLSKSLQIPMQEDVLKRTKMTSTQTQKSRLERWNNVESIFMVRKKLDLKSKRVLIVDDVITTGSTIESCVLALQAAGAKDVSVIAIAAAR